MRGSGLVADNRADMAPRKGEKVNWEEIKPAADETFGCDSSKITMLDLWHIAKQRGMKPHEVVRAIEREA